ncbi:hypothetical protein [Mobiluncus mulieris]|uniref:Uncharacterized protein n=1 Tax=Mobiluncus mulieris TaxID=2052 RepID=A0ABD4U146_9ACTO|nr:hypothetical protein [Mobiluncus mulieris]MCU9969791.1 hypothetical protein [Mobiluncus mulieris]MCU9974171.1 hypothetical protein [Mobiluncus mulieris]MCV0010316.1 hypothetical protein [Mobiluncus mulieris]NMW76012.1 hypothetical protein [Mobiluncus mulieris]
MPSLNRLRQLLRRYAAYAARRSPSTLAHAKVSPLSLAARRTPLHRLRLLRRVHEVPSAKLSK